MCAGSPREDGDVFTSMRLIAEVQWWEVAVSGRRQSKTCTVVSTALREHHVTCYTQQTLKHFPYRLNRGVHTTDDLRGTHGAAMNGVILMQWNLSCPCSRHEVIGAWRYGCYLFLISSLQESKLSASRPDRFTPGNESPVPTEQEVWWAQPVQTLGENQSLLLLTCQ